MGLDIYRVQRMYRDVCMMRKDVPRVWATTRETSDTLASRHFFACSVQPHVSSIVKMVFSPFINKQPFA
jgi:hypothetical protein